MTHEVFTIVAPVRDRAASTHLKQILAEINANPSGNARLPFGRLPMVHFASFVVFSDPVQEKDAPSLPDQFVFESCIDGPFDDYIEALLHLGLTTLHELFSCCSGYHAASPSYDDVKAYIVDRRRKPHLLHIGSPGLRVDHIEAGARLRRVLDRELDDVVKRGRSIDRPLDLMRTLRASLNVPPSTRDHWFLQEPTPEQGEQRRFAWFADQQSHLASQLWHWGKFFALALTLLAVVWFGGSWLWNHGRARSLFFALAGLVAAQRLFWWWLTRGKPWEGPTAKQKEEVRTIKELEDQAPHVQNKMASLVILKSGWMTWIVTRAVLWLFNVLYRTWFTDLTPGRLAGLHTIHFGHWTVLDLETEGHTEPKTKRKAVMFLSNYDSSWETYLDDFIARLYNGVVAIWAGGVGFPKPLDGPSFKSWARTRMSVWHAWYRAYPTLTVANIDNNEHIRRGLVDLPGTDDAARLWLSRFGSFKTGNEHIDAPADALETHDIQGLVLSGYAHLPYAKYVLLRIDKPDEVRAWLAELMPHVTDARPSPRSNHRAIPAIPAINVAFTHSGLRELGLPASALDEFPLPFQEGMAPAKLKHRSRALGDVGENDPACWRWGGPTSTRVDLLVMFYADSEAELAKVVDQRLKRVIDSQAATSCLGSTLSGELLADSDRKNPAGRQLFREHFGFADGISQPEIEGTYRAVHRVAERGSQHLVKPGEFLLGYMAGDGTVNPGIPIDARLDSHALLPPAASVRRQDLREFGRNGTYLVFRQLEQRVAEFRNFVAHVAGPSTSPQDAEEFAARLVGRRRDGEALIVADSDHGHSNEFTFANDPHGFACPIGSHVRRANPRDSLTADPAAALRLANRHRLLRRGRPYGTPLSAGAAPTNGDERGMHFICLNGDIERQFEFVQQNWVNNTVFSGLGCEQDGLVGAPGGEPGCFTVQSTSVRQRTLHIPSFVTVRGGAYFFLPGVATLRYLATLNGAGAEILPPSVFAPANEAAVIVRRQPSRLRRTLAALEGQLPRVRLAWAARYPLLMAAAMILWPLAAGRRASFFGSHFLVGWWGIAIVSLLASLAAFVVMISLRLVLLYGWRSRPGLPRWTGSARWFQVLGFQALSLPLVLTAIHSSATDAADLDGRSYWEFFFSNLAAGVIGAVAAIVLLTLASSVQALRPGARPDLFFPPNFLSKRLAGASNFRVGLSRLSQWLSRLSRWIVSSVPEEIGIGYIDYRSQRLLPGHAFAASVGLVLILIYAAGYLTLNPAWSDRWTSWGHEIPALAYLIFALIAIGTLLSMLAFFFDRYGIPTVIPLALWLAIVASVARTDHFYNVLGVVQPPSLTPADVVRHADSRYPGSKVIVVAAEGYGLTSSAWTAEVLATLAEKAGGRRFTDSLRLVSASSGAALGTTYFVEAYERGGFPTSGNGQTVDDRALARIREAAWQPSDSENAWGLVYPDLTRTFAPLLVPRRFDRGWAMEQAWRRQMRDPGASLNGWRLGVAEGWRPSTAFGVTVVETGGRHLFATYDANPCAPRAAGCSDEVTHGYDVPIVTAARLAATFPIVAPVARAHLDAAAYHLSDGGIWDNFGVTAALEWLERALPALESNPDVPRRDVLLIEIRSSPTERARPPEEERAWAYELIGPLQAMNGVRSNAQRVRNELEVSLLSDRWASSTNAPALTRVVFELSDPQAKLAWHIGRRDLQRIKNAWSLDKNRASLETVQAFLGVQP